MAKLATVETKTFHGVKRVPLMVGSKGSTVQYRGETHLHTVDLHYRHVGTQKNISLDRATELLGYVT